MEKEEDNSDRVFHQSHKVNHMRKKQKGEKRE